jgi:hypothetical protein
MSKVGHLHKVRIFQYYRDGTLSSRAIYQRFIVLCLGSQVSSMTRGALAKLFAKRFSIHNRTAYGHVLIELQECLIPYKIVEEEGIIPALRGPLILQAEGIPCYRLTKTGSLVYSCLEELNYEERKKALERYLAYENISNIDELIIREQLLVHLGEYPEFTLELVKHGVSQFLDGQISHPFDIVPRHKRQGLRSLAPG